MKNVRLISLFLIIGIIFSPAVFAQLGCNPGITECVGTDAYRICDNYAVWGPTLYCSQGQSCVNGNCSGPLGCNPGTTECVGTDAYRICDNYAVWGPTLYCSQGQSCVNGKCQAPLGCNPGITECVGTDAYRICDNYAVWGPTLYCSQGQSCVNGKCSPSPQCSYQQTRCSPSNPNEIQQCNYQQQWQDWKYCSNGCTGSGYCMNCNPGDTRCSDSTSYQKCDSDGTWGSTHDCGSNQVCDSGSCVQSPQSQCDNYGATRCSPDDASSVQRCGSNNRWQNYQYCQNGCDYGKCVSCGTGEKQCVDSQSYATCNSQGQWGASVACQSGYLCSAGSCVAPAGTQCATPGVKRCSPSNANMLQVCGNNNIYQDYLTCPQGCSNGQCAECTAGTTMCAGANAYRTCNNGQLSDPINCPSGYNCDNGQCEASVQCVKGMRECVSNNVYVCSDNSWQLLLQCPSYSDCVESAGTAYCTQQKPTPPPPQPVTPTNPFELGALGIVFVVATLVLGAALVYFYLKMKK
ncbi:MAG: hypothetical protein V1492_03090 [Candidatus Micrarchaeota archaeon]